MSNTYTIDGSKSTDENLTSAFGAIGVTLAGNKYGFGLSGDGVQVRGFHSGSLWSTSKPKLDKVQLWVEEPNRKTIRRVAVASGGSLDLDKLKAKFEELKAMVPEIDRQKEERRKREESDNEDRDKTRAERDALFEEVGLGGLGTLEHRREKDIYRLALHLQTPDEVRQVVAHLKEMRNV